jgi:hypothetical protein
MIVFLVMIVVDASMPTRVAQTGIEEEVSRPIIM